MVIGRQRLDWVDMAKGLSIFLVVIMYCASSVGDDTGQTGFLHWAMAFAMPFRMPEFFLISGLFLSQAIDRPWRAYLDRRFIHYVYFYVLWVIIHVLFKVALVEGNPGAALSALAFAIIEPYGVWWFIYMLAVFGLVTKLLYEIKIPAWATLGIATALQVSSIHTGSYLIDQFAAYFIYFQCGYLFAPRLIRLATWTQVNSKMAGCLLVVWALANAVVVFSPGFRLDPVHIQMGWGALPGVHLIAALAGATAIVVAAALLLSLPWMGWLQWLGTQSLVIYVAFVLPMGISRTLLLGGGFNEPNLLSLITMIAAIGSPLVLWWITGKIGFGRFLFERPRWAHLPIVERAETTKPHPIAAE